MTSPVRGVVSGYGCVLSVLVVLLISGFLSAYPTNSNLHGAVIVSVVFSASFLLSLCIMDTLTRRANGEKRGDIVNKLKQLKNELSSDEAKAKAEIEIVRLVSEPVEILDRREIRRALTISITIAYFTVLSFALFGELKDTQVISEFSKIFIVVIAFYFGSRAIEDTIKLRKELFSVKKKVGDKK